MANANPFTKWIALPLLATALAAAGTAVPVPSEGTPAQGAPEAKPGNTQVTSDSKSPLSDAFIAQGTLRVFLDHPASVTVYNARGQQVYHRDSMGPVETVPLQGITTGFVYLTVRAGKTEATRKLVYTGK
jgi:hypothetical protein